MLGVELINKLKQEGVETLYVQTVSGVSTGVALITLSQAENSIVVVPGANHAMSPACVSIAEEAFLAADVVLCQLEIPLSAVEARSGAWRLSTEKPFLLNPAPATALPKVLLAGATLLTPNEHELSLVFESEESDWQSTLVQHPQRILMTRGADGAWFTDALPRNCATNPGLGSMRSIRPVPVILSTEPWRPFGEWKCRCLSAWPALPVRFRSLVKERRADAPIITLKRSWARKIIRDKISKGATTAA